MATIDDVTQAIRNADAAGDSASVRALAPVLQQMIHQQNVAATTAQMATEYAPTVGMSGTDKFLAGAGKAFSDLGSGVKQIFTGNSNQQEIDDTKRRDAPLMATGAGLAGNITGNVAAVVPTAFIPGVNGLAGSAALGATLGGIQPVASDESRLKNIAVGGAAGLAGPVVARGVTAVAQGAKALVEPFTAGGRQAIAGRTLESFGVTPADVAGLSGAPTITGAVPMLAEQITNPQAAAGAARLQDSLASLDPNIGARMAAGATQNNAARVATLEGVAGSDGARDFAAANREGMAKQLYESAFAPKQTVFRGTQTPEAVAGDSAKFPGTFATDSPEYAASYGPNVKPYDIAHGSNILDMDVSQRGSEAEGFIKNFLVNQGSVTAQQFDRNPRLYMAQNFMIPTPEWNHALTEAGYDGVKMSAPNAKAAELYFPNNSTLQTAGKVPDPKKVEGLLQMPAIQDAMASAKEIAANQGINIQDPSGSVQGLHLMKLAMDDAINSAGKSGSAIGVNKAKSIEMAKNKLVSVLDDASPDYAAARQTYAAMSKPVNQMDVAQTILDRSAPNTTDLAGNPTLSAAKMGNVLANEPQLIKAATGRPGVANSLSDLMEPDQLAKISSVAQEVDRAAAVAKAGNGPGSGTAQRMASTNVLRQLLGPTGLPQSWAESALLGTAARPLQFGAQLAEPKIQMTLADLILDPSKAQAALAAANPTQRTALQKVLSNPDVKRIASQVAPAALASPNDR